MFLVLSCSTNNLAGLPELDDVDHLLGRADWQGQEGEDLRPGEAEDEPRAAWAVVLGGGRRQDGGHGEGRVDGVV